MNNKDHMHRFDNEFKNNMNSPAFQAVYICHSFQKLSSYFSNSSILIQVQCSNNNKKKYSFKTLLSHTLKGIRSRWTSTIFQIKQLLYRYQYIVFFLSSIYLIILFIEQKIIILKVEKKAKGFKRYKVHLWIVFFFCLILLYTADYSVWLDFLFLNHAFGSQE